MTPLNLCMSTCSLLLTGWKSKHFRKSRWHGYIWGIVGLGLNALISKLEHVVRTLDSTRTYSRHLTAVSWKLWCKLVRTVDTLFKAVSMNMAFS